MYLKSFDLPLITSYYTELPKDLNHIFYKKIPTDLMFDEEIGYLYQKASNESNVLINSIYKQGSTVYNTADSTDKNIVGEHLENRKKDFLNIVFSLFEKGDLFDLDVLEVGCSTGYILNEFKKLNAKVLGCDPGPWKEIAMENYGIEIVNDYFSSKIFGGRKFDFIYSFAFLDQMINPLNIILEMKKLLKPKGKILTAVRDFSNHIKLGNPFGINPEHTIYFNEKSLRNLYEKAGLGNILIRYAEYGYGIQIMGDCTKDGPGLSTDLDELRTQAIQYAEKNKKLVLSLQNRIRNFKGRSIGLMGACIETANLLSMLDFNDIILYVYEFDSTFVDKFFSSVRIKISHEQNILIDHPDEIWIVPISHAQKIEKKLKEELNVKIPIVNFMNYCQEL